MPLSMNIFKNDAFSTVSLTAAVEKIDYVPGLLGSLGIFEPEPVFTSTIAVEKKETSLTLIPTSPIGAPPRETNRSGRTVRNFAPTNLKDSFTMYAHELDGIRAFNTESELETLQTEYASRMAKVKGNMELTHEFHRLGALQGKLIDADGVTVLYNFFTEFGIAEPAAINFALTTATTDVWTKCQEVKRAVQRAAKGVFTPATQVHALAGDSFYDSLVTHPKVQQFYINWQAAQGLREQQAFESFTFGGITFHNYRGTDDNSTVAIPTAECKFFPVGAKGVFKKAMAPTEFFPWVNTRGQDIYALNIVDDARQAWVKGELYSHPLYMCCMPEVLQKAVRA
jgi:hypothetical protein